MWSKHWLHGLKGRRLRVFNLDDLKWVKAVVRDKNITEQSEVDAMAKSIEDAIAALQYKDADYTKVDVYKRQALDMFRA